MACNDGQQEHRVFVSICVHLKPLSAVTRITGHRVDIEHVKRSAHTLTPLGALFCDLIAKTYVSFSKKTEKTR